ncbi:MAG: caspase family protein [Caulobacterales bacterium]|uniref:caspase family protein n=1 Tax=Glycocaulis sp. TaxID=1969725 RepID=UPI003FA10CB2
MNPLRHLVLAGIAVTSVLGALANADEPQRHALLIGASGYDEARIGPGVELLGPRNDVALMIRALRAYDVPDTNMLVLADGLDQTGIDFAAHGDPTRAEILAAFSAMLERANPGDEVLIYFSGHGSRQPQPEDAAEREANGFDEIFLPLDIGHWEGAQGDRQAGVQNALIDDEIGTFLEDLRARNVFVWLVVDTCHSGGANRSAGPGGEFRTRAVTEDLLGIPAEARIAAEQRAQATRSGTPSVRPESALSLGEGGFVAFYAAHSGQLALEGLMPKVGAAETRDNFGVMTFHIANGLLAGGVGSYRDLAYRVLSGYNDWGSRAPAPLFEGDLDRTLLGQGGALRSPQWHARFLARETTEIEAGYLEGVGEGAVFEIIVRDPDTQGPHPSFPGPYYVEAVEVGQTATRAVLTAFEGNEAARALPGRTAFMTARMVDPGVRLSLSVAIDPSEADLNAREQLATDALTRLGEANPETLIAPLDFREPGEPADVRIRVHDNAVWFLRSEADIVPTGRDRSARIAIDDTATIDALMSQIEGELQKLARVRNILNASSAFQGSNGLENLTFETFVWRATPPRLGPDARAADDWACSLPDPTQIPAEAVSLEELGTSELNALELSHCDIVYVRLTNTGDRPIDVTPLYIDSQAGIHRLPFLGTNASTRIEPGEQPRIVWAGLRTFDWTTGYPASAGLERLVLLAIEREEGAALPMDFGFLTQTSLSRSAGETASDAERSPLGQLMTMAAFGGSTTRSARARPALDTQAGSILFQWRLVPPGESEG